MGLLYSWGFMERIKESQIFWREGTKICYALTHSGFDERIPLKNVDARNRQEQKVPGQRGNINYIVNKN